MAPTVDHLEEFIGRALTGPAAVLGAGERRAWDVGAPRSRSCLGGPRAPRRVPARGARLRAQPRVRGGSQASLRDRGRPSSADRVPARARWRPICWRGFEREAARRQVAVARRRDRPARATSTTSLVQLGVVGETGQPGARVRRGHDLRERRRRGAGARRDLEPRRCERSPVYQTLSRCASVSIPLQARSLGRRSFAWPARSSWERSSTIPRSRSSGTSSRSSSRPRAVRWTASSTRNYELQVDGAARRPHRHRLELAAGLGRRPAPHRRPVPRHRHARHRPRPRHAHRRPQATRRRAAVEDLRGQDRRDRRQDSPQATLHPAPAPARHGLVAGPRLPVRRFDVLVGKHGDHVGGELEALHACNAAKRRRRRARPQLGAWRPTAPPIPAS